MAGDAAALVENLDRGVGDARLDHLADEPRRHRVVMVVDLDVIVGRDPALLPFRIAIGLVRKRLSAGRSIVSNSSRRLLPSLRMTGVEIGDAFTDRGVEFVEREEAPIAQPCQHESLDDLNRDLHLRLVARLAHPGRQHNEAVVVGQILIGAIDAGLVARRLGDAGLEIVADHRLRHAANRGERIDMRADPIGKPLRPARLRVGVVRGAERGDEDVRRSHLPVAGSNTAIVSPAKSTNSFSPATCVWRIVAEMRRRHSPYSSQNRL